MTIGHDSLLSLAHFRCRLLYHLLYHLLCTRRAERKVLKNKRLARKAAFQAHNSINKKRLLLPCIARQDERMKNGKLDSIIYIQEGLSKFMSIVSQESKKYSLMAGTKTKGSPSLAFSSIGRTWSRISVLSRFSIILSIHVSVFAWAWNTHKQQTTISIVSHRNASQECVTEIQERFRRDSRQEYRAVLLLTYLNSWVTFKDLLCFRYDSRLNRCFIQKINNLDNGMKSCILCNQRSRQTSRAEKEH